MIRRFPGWVGVVASGALLLGGCATTEMTPTDDGTTPGERRDIADREAVSERSERSGSGGSGGEGRSRESGPVSDHAKLTADLNEASRELAALRAQNARLRAERESGGGGSGRSGGNSAPAREAAVPRTDPVDEKLAAAFKSYSALRQELAGVLAEMEKARSESAAAAARLKEVSSRTEDSRTTIARLERDLQAERRARDEAEQRADKLQEQLRTIAKALGDAGLSVDKLSEPRRDRR